VKGTRRSRTLREALKSALDLCPQRTQTKTVWLLRLARSQCPHLWQVLDVLRASTGSTLIPCLLATCASFKKSEEKGHPWWINRCFLATLILARMPLRSSTAIVPALTFKASSTIPFATFQSNHSTDLFLFARQPLQEPSLISALAPCGLKIAALFESALSNVLDNSALENLACAGRGDTDDTRIYADARVTIRVGNIFCNDQMQIPDSTFMGDCSCRLVPPRPAEILPVVVGEDQVKLDSAAESSQRGVFLIEFDCQRSSVVPHRRCLFPPVMFVFISLVRFRNHVASRANEVGRKLRHFPYASIGDVVKRHRAKDVLLEGNVRGVVERHCVCFLSLGERLRNLLSYLKLYLQRDSYSHVGNIYHLTYRYCNRVLRYAKPTRNADFLRPATSRQSPSAKLMNRRKIQCSD
jgi:hypothetical protein